MVNTESLVIYEALKLRDRVKKKKVSVSNLREAKKIHGFETKSQTRRHEGLSRSQQMHLNSVEANVSQLIEFE